MVSLKAWGMSIAKRRGMAWHGSSWPASSPSSCTACGATAKNSALERKPSPRPAPPPPDDRNPKGRRDRQQSRPKGQTRIVPVGTTGKAISLRVQSLPAKASKVVKQIETLGPPDPSCGGYTPIAKRSA